MSINIFRFCLLSFLSYYNNAQYQPLPICTATLTTSKTSENGANVTILDPNVVTISNNAWNINIPYWMYTSNIDQIGFDMFINLNQSWGFHPSKESTITLTIYSDTSTGRTDEDLIISFSVDNSKYFSIFFTLDNNYGNAIYPTCGNALATGNINNIVSTSSNTPREVKAFANTCCNYRLQPNSYSYNNYWPIIISLRNNPSSNRLYLSVTNPIIQPNKQTCEFSSSFPANKGLQIYIASDDYNDEIIYLKQFKIDYSFQLTYPPTNNPSSPPTQQPTYAAPTISPTPAPTENPTNIPTLFPTYNPTHSPTTLSPTLFPTQSPSDIPTTTPSQHPTLSPITKLQTSFPTPRPVIIVVDQTSSPTSDHSGSVDQDLSTTTESLAESNHRKNTSTILITHVIIVISIFSFLLCCLFALMLLYIRRKKKLQQKNNVDKMKQHINNKDTTSLRTGTDEQKFAVNLSFSNSAEGVNNILINDIVNGQTPQLPPPPPKRAKSNECKIEMSSFVTPVDDDTGTEDTGTDETNESVMDKTLTNDNNNYNDMDDMDILDDIVITPGHVTLGNVLNENVEYNNPNVMKDEFIVGSEGFLSQLQ